MAAPSYVYKIADWKTGVRLAELPLSGLTFTRMLQPLGLGTWQASLPLGDPLMAKLDPIFNTEPSAVQLVVERNQAGASGIHYGEVNYGDGALYGARSSGVSQIVFAGPVLSRGYSSKSQALILGGRESWALFDRRMIEWDLTYTAVDQGAICSDLITRDAGKPDGDMRVDLPTSLTTGIPRTTSYLASDVKPISAAIEELAALQSGFEFYLEPYWSTDAFGVDTLRHTLRFGYPQLGTSGGGYNWELPGATNEYSWMEDGSALLNEVFGIADDGTGKPSIVRSKLLLGRYPLLQGPMPIRTLTTLATATAAAAEAVAQLNAADVQAQVAVVGDQPPALGSYQLGDSATFNFNDPRFMGAGVAWRLGGWSVTTPGPDQAESVALILIAP